MGFAARWCAVMAAGLLLVSSCAGEGAQGDEAGRLMLLDLTEQEFLDERVDLFVLSPLLSAVGIDPGLSRTYTLATMRLLEEGIEECMRRAGFAYVAHVTADDVGDTWLPAMSRAEFAEHHGFGSRLDAAVLSLDGLAGEDPNEDYLASLSDEERAGWKASLEGVEGCAAAGAAAVWGDAEQAYDALIDQAGREIASHAATQRATDEYLACTAAAGYPWLNNPFNSRLIGVQAAAETAMSPDEEQAAAEANLRCLYPAELARRSVAHQVETRLVDAHAELIAEMRDVFSAMTAQ